MPVPSMNHIRGSAWHRAAPASFRSRWLRQAGAVLCCGITLIFGVHSPAYGSHGRTIVSADGISATEPKFEVLRLVENIFIIDSTPSNNGSSGPYCPGPRWSANGDWGSENKCN